VVGVPDIPDDFSEGRVKETVEPCTDLGSKVGETGDADKTISEPRRELCGIATTVSGDGTLGSEFSDDELNDPAGRRRKIEVTAVLVCVNATRVW
jgi:hypothetical protein